MNEQNHRVVMAILSLGLMALVIFAAFHIFPLLNPPPQLAASYTVLGNINANAGEGPIYTLGTDFFPHQCGKARLSSTLSLFPYSDPVCRAGITNFRPYLMAADVRVPWAVVPTAERENLRHLAGIVLDQWEVVAKQLFQSAFFRQYYVPTFKELAQNALRQAWTTPATEQVLSRAIHSFDRSQLNNILEGIVPIVLEKAKQNLWQTMRSYAAAILGASTQADQEAVLRLAAEVFADPRIREHLTQTFPPLLTNRAVVMVAAVMARESFRTILDDPRTMPLLGRLLTDQRFLSLQPFTPELEQLIRTMPLRLMRLRRRFDHNPLATYILRNLIRGRRGFLVLMLSPEQEQQLAESDLPSGPALRKINP